MAEKTAPQIYNYSRYTGEYIPREDGEPVFARLDPIEQEPMIPANSTTIAPPAAGADEVAVFDPSLETWSVLADHRGEIWFTPDLKVLEITAIGVVPDPTWTTELPPPPFSDLVKRGHNKINTDAEITRGTFITFGDGMSIVYQLKREEALSYTPAMDPTEFPLMNERATRLGVPLADVQAEWMIKVNEWYAAAASIESVRESAHGEIDLVTDTPTAEEEIQAIIDGAIWPT